MWKYFEINIITPFCYFLLIFFFYILWLLHFSFNSSINMFVMAFQHMKLKQMQRQ